MTEREMLEEAFNRAKQVLAKVEMEAAAYRPTEVPSRLVTELTEQRQKVAELQSRLSEARPQTNSHLFARPRLEWSRTQRGRRIFFITFCLLMLGGTAFIVTSLILRRNVTYTISYLEPTLSQPTKAVQLSSPPAGVENATPGLTIFRQQCQACHPSLGKVAGVGPKLTNSPNAGDPNYIRNTIRNGKSPMPSFPSNQISDTDLENLVAYIASIRTK
jgi:mono/diheme cytochrome c family protein